jgi:hypothetical protein
MGRAAEMFSYVGLGLAGILCVFLYVLMQNNDKE